MTVYTAISKSIGWDNPQIFVTYPSIEDAKVLLEEVSNKNKGSFYTVFRLYRFGGFAKSEQEVEVVNIIHHAYQIGEEIWRKVEEPASIENDWD